MLKNKKFLVKIGDAKITGIQKTENYTVLKIQYRGTETFLRLDNKQVAKIVSELENPSLELKIDPVVNTIYAKTIGWSDNKVVKDKAAFINRISRWGYTVLTINIHRQPGSLLLINIADDTSVVSSRFIELFDQMTQKYEMEHLLDWD